MSSAVVLPNEQKTPEQLREVFSTDEILWFRDGRWGDAGYAIPSGQGKASTDNSTVYKIHKLIGATLFDLMHREDVKFSDPPHKQFWWDWQLSIIRARQILDSIAVDAGTTKNAQNLHITATPREFLVFPVPFFGMRVRQEDILEQCELCLKLLGEIQQHSAADRTYYITGNFARMVNGWLTEMQMKVAINYFGYTRDDVVKAGSAFKIADEKFSAESYKPEWTMPSPERTTEGPPRQWWPTENDLSAIKGIAYTDAIHFAARWPVASAYEGDWETSNPGIINRVKSGDPASIGAANPSAANSGDSASVDLDERPGMAP